MKSSEIRERYLKFFEKRGHTIVSSASLIPGDYPIPDKGSLFTTAGMQPLIPYLLGEKHPSGTRLVDIQKCVRTGDIDDVGDNRHLTFFEMMGNWSLGDYFKKDSIAWSLDFLTNKEEGLGLDPKRFYMTVFKGEDGIPRDEDSIAIWKENFAKHGINAEVAGDDEYISGEVRILPLGKDDNFWIAGSTGPCGGDTEMFYDVLGEEKGGKLEGKFADLVKAGRIIEVWNNVFMEFNKTADGKYEKLAKPNVDTGMGLERTTVVMQGKENVFETDLFTDILAVIDSKKTKTNIQAERVVADHIRSAVFMITDGVIPSNTEAGYVLRRVLRRAIRFADTLGIADTANLFQELIIVIVKQFKDAYPELVMHQAGVIEEIIKEERKFKQTLQTGLKEFDKIKGQDISGIDAFKLFTTFGFPFELTLELAKENNIKVDIECFESEMKKHQELSKVGAEQKFKGGLAGTGEIETKYHTATHLLNAALRQVLGEHVSQKGSNITTERLRFDFAHGEKMTDEQKKKVEDYVNGVIALRLPVTCKEMSVAEAKESGAQGVFTDKYDAVVKVYTVGNEADHYSKEICGGPHISNTSELGKFKIVKEEAVSAGVRRIKATIE
jgi:alanyl-tRNA synthetase